MFTRNLGSHSGTQLSYVIGLYFRKFAHLNNTYRAIGAVIGLMIRLYWTGFAMLVGAGLNADLAKQSQLGPIPPKEEPHQLPSWILGEMIITAVFGLVPISLRLKADCR
jgi:hypothetical protein